MAQVPRGAGGQPQVILLGNTGGPLLDPALNGLTLEGIGVVHSAEEAIEWALAQQAVSVAPTLSVGWIRKLASVVPTTYFAEQTGSYLGELTFSEGGEPQEF